MPNHLTTPTTPVSDVPMDAEAFFSACSRLVGRAEGMVATSGGDDAALMALARDALVGCHAAAPLRLPPAACTYRNRPRALAALNSRNGAWLAGTLDPLAATLAGAVRIDPARTTAVLLPPSGRGDGVASDYALPLVQRLMTRHPGSQVWLHAAEDPPWQAYRRRFGERCSALSWPWTPTGARTGRARLPAFPPLVDVRISADSSVADATWHPGLASLALLRAMGRCQWQVVPTGHLGLWAAMLRGHVRNLWQIDENQRAINPQAPGGWFGTVRRYWLGGARPASV